MKAADVPPSTDDTQEGEGAMENQVEEMPVKSSAVVKYSWAPPRAGFALLRQHTDLKLPPANWLRGAARLGTQPPGLPGTARANHPFSSFGMAFSFIDSIGRDVDVVSDSENIKKLLKIAYSKGSVSLAVHRVGRTLLLDHLDPHDILMRSSQTGDWQWLKDLYQKLAAGKCPRKKKSREQLHRRAILSKFLYHSIGDGSQGEMAQGQGDHGQPMDNQDSSRGDELWLTWPPQSCPEPPPSPQMEPIDNDFQRNVLWTFEDIRMLVGSNLPIFGGGKYPAVSLRLRDSNKPINILTGIDYWLDNLMCNVPELVMCFHVDGIVQKYEMIKTEDIPDLETSRFSTRVIRDIAQNVLSFLKANCTREGHTYWLFKASGDDIVKLYDLTTLCEETRQEKNENPFAYPVAVLLFRVANSLVGKKAERRKRRRRSTARTLLQNCIRLLDKEKHPQLLASASCMLCDLFPLDEGNWKRSSGEKGNNEVGKQDKGGVDASGDGMGDRMASNCLDPIGCFSSDEDEDKEENDDDDTRDGDDEEDGEVGFENGVCRQEDTDKDIEEDNVASKFRDSGAIVPGSDRESECAIAVIPSAEELSEPAKYKTWHPYKASSGLPCGSLEESCHAVLTHVAQALRSVDSSLQQCGPPSLDPSTPIPLKYTQALDSSFDLSITDIKPPPHCLPSGCWQQVLKQRLSLRAARAYHGLAQAATKRCLLGRSLTFVHNALQCLDACNFLGQGASFPGMRRCLCRCLLLCGDLQLWIGPEGMENGSNGKPGEANESGDLPEVSDLNLQILQSLEIHAPCHGFSWATENCNNRETCLALAARCYEASWKLVPAQALSKEDSGLDTEVAAELMDGPNLTSHSALTTALLKRLGNVRNELGVLCMERAAKFGKQVGRTSSAKQDLWSECLCCFEQGLRDFTAAGDKSNAALLLCNMGRLMRLSAHARSTQDQRRGSAASPQSLTRRGEFSAEEGHFYEKAVNCYQRALSMLGTRQTQPVIWDAVSWELSSTYFTCASLLQDYAPLSRKAQEQVENEVRSFMRKALQFCEIPSDSPKHPLCEYRAATIHHRLGSLHHNSIRNQVGNEVSRKHARELAEKHYGAAAQLFLKTLSPCELIRVHLERLALMELRYQGRSSVVAKRRGLEASLDVLLSTEPALCLLEQETEHEKTNGGKSEGEQGEKKTTAEQAIRQKHKDNVVKPERDGKKPAGKCKNKEEPEGEFEQKKERQPEEDQMKSQSETEQENNEVERLLGLLANRLASVLLQLLTQQGSNARKNSSPFSDPSVQEAYRGAYLAVLRTSSAQSGSGNLPHMLRSVLSQLPGHEASQEHPPSPRRQISPNRSVPSRPRAAKMDGT
uniref:erythroid differentiation-related factor 1 n=1 Tax=Myxine glutinosa TaxID=7769 RepID=UPI00358EDA32